MRLYRRRFKSGIFIYVLFVGSSALSQNNSMLDKRTIIQTLRSNLDILRTQFHISRMGLFGSFSPPY